MIIVVFLVGLFILTALSVMLALPAGLALMLLMSVLNGWNQAVPTMDFWTAYAVSLSLSAFLLFVRPNVPLNSD